jgi:hypothetical protein
MFKPQDWLDRVFEIGIIGKGLNGVAELIGGLLLLFLTPGRIHYLVASLTQGELSEDPHDFVATHLLHTASRLTGNRLDRLEPEHLERLYQKLIGAGARPATAHQVQVAVGQIRAVIPARWMPIQSCRFRTPSSGATRRAGSACPRFAAGR